MIFRCVVSDGAGRPTGLRLLKCCASSSLTAERLSWQFFAFSQSLHSALSFTVTATG